MKATTNFIAITTLALCIFNTTVSAQTLNQPTPADNPNIAGNSAWTSACASADFNEYFVNFTWSPPLVASTNEFILELSDADGAFDSPRELARVADKNTEFDFDFSFSLAADIQGDGYRFRVRSTSPAITSAVSDAYSMYFIGYNDPILISQDASGVIPPGGRLEVCGGNSITLATHNVPDAGNYTYSWYRSGTPLSENSNSLTVTQSGMYFVEIDYGVNCSGSANTLSNTIEVSFGTSQGIAINTPSNTTLCSTETVTLQANISGMGYLYTWFNGDTIVSGPNVDESSYLVDGSVSGFEGDYSVRIEGAGICAEQSAPVTINSAGDYNVVRVNEPNLVLLPSRDETLTVSTDANSPSFQWFRNGNPISGATSASLTINQAGTYYAAVTENGGPCTLPAKNSEDTVVVLPQSFELTIDYVGTYSDCSSSEVTLTVLQIDAIDPSNNRIDVTGSLRNEFSYQWHKDGAALAGITSDEILLSDVADNGFYTLESTLAAFNATSNPLSVRLAPESNLTIDASGLQVCDGVTIDLSTPTDLTGVEFSWIRDGVTVSSDETTLTTNETGTYQLSISADGCPILSNEIVLTEFDASIVSIDQGNTIVFPQGETELVTASGASSYEWYDASNTLLSSSDNISLTDEGDYTLLAAVGGCTITLPFSVSYRDNFEVPNVISANGDGINDLWVIPNTFSRNNEITVTIYNEQGEEVLNEVGYQNNWPASSTAFTKRNQIFYYKIRNAQETLRQGTITVIR